MYETLYDEAQPNVMPEGQPTNINPPEPTDVPNPDDPEGKEIYNGFVSILDRYAQDLTAREYITDP